MNGPTSNGNHLNTITEEFRESIRGAARNNNLRNTDGDDEDSSGRELDGQTLNGVRSGRSFRQGGNGTPGNHSPGDRTEKQPLRQDITKLNLQNINKAPTTAKIRTIKNKKSSKMEGSGLVGLSSTAAIEGTIASIDAIG